MRTREFHPGMGQAVAERTILRKKQDGTFETWADVARRVALGNTLLCDAEKEDRDAEFEKMHHHMAKVTLLMSGRHLQHGDEDQPDRNQEVFTNCSTASVSFMSFLLLMSGSGVGRCFDDDMMLVDFDYAPNILCVIDQAHPDFDYLSHNSVRDAIHKYGRSDSYNQFAIPQDTQDPLAWAENHKQWQNSLELVELNNIPVHNNNVIWFDVPDSREGWAKAVEVYESLAYERVHKDKLLILNFSPVRPRMMPIQGMQGRPASGPVPLMQAFERAASIKGGGMDQWLQAMYVDHYFAECVLVGGARRAARMSVKSWRDKSVIDYINIKRPIEYHGKSLEEIILIRKSLKPLSFLWSSNNSILVDKEFWDLLKLTVDDDGYSSELACHARNVFDALVLAAYADGTGEPGIINVDKLVQNNEGLELLNPDNLLGSDKFQINKNTLDYIHAVFNVAIGKIYHMLTNPCGEVNLALWGAYCTIADVVPFFADSLDEAEDAFRMAARSLIRVNTMDSIYNSEVKRTNRIGVGITGIHEFAWKFFGYNFYDLIDEEKSKDFWMAMSRFARAVQEEAFAYCRVHGTTAPHTVRVSKPSGTVSKLWGLTEGIHLPSMAWYLRWVQFSENDPLVETYANVGYPTRKLKSYKGTTIVGFPTKLAICDLMPDDKIVYAGDATPEQQYQWLKLLEKYWIECVDENGDPMDHRGSQLSYTLKYDPYKVSFEEFARTLKDHQSQIRCCSVMPQEDSSSYEYLPEEPISKEDYDSIVANINAFKSRDESLDLVEDIGKEHLECENGACPIDFKKDK